MAKTKSISSDTRINVVKRLVTLNGITPIMFDRYPGDNGTKLSWHEKIYLIPGTNQICLPMENLFSFYTAQNTTSAPKRLRDARKYKEICAAIATFTMVSGTDGNDWMPIMRERDGKPIEVGTFSENHDELSGLVLHRSVARLDKGVPNPKERPMLPLPWCLQFVLTIMPNEVIKEAEIRNLTIAGGMAVGLGTFRPRFGKFVVESWEDFE